jgi:hypothetical protein
VKQSLFPELLADIEQRIQFRELSSILKTEGIPTAQGWKKLLEKLQEVELGNPALASKTVSLLRELQKGLVVAGTKQLYIFDLEPSEVTAIAAEINAMQIPNNEYSLAFPKELSKNSLIQKSQDHELASRIDYANGDIALVLCAKRTQEERTSYRVNEVTQAVQKAFEGYDSFIAIKKTDYQVFDVINLRHSLRRLEILIDHPDRVQGLETLDGRMLTILGRASLSIPSLVKTYNDNAPLNLKSCIQSLYDDKSQGRVAQLCFRTPTKSVNRGSMTSKEDLRLEPFHEAGAAQVGAITVYDVVIFWDKLPKVSAEVGVHVGMTIAGLSAEDVSVNSAKVLSAMSDSAVVAVGNKLVSYSG